MEFVRLISFGKLLGYGLFGKKPFSLQFRV